MQKWLQDVFDRESELPIEIREVFRNFRNALGEECEQDGAWTEVSRDLWITLKQSSPKRKAINRIYHILHSRKRKVHRLLNEESLQDWAWYMQNTLNEILEILEDAWMDGYWDEDDQ